jgi:hypothetical protein
MRFTQRQYDEAIASLKEARGQLEPDGNSCACCGDAGHMAFECGHNPLVAMALCRRVAQEAEALHETLHYLSGWDSAFGVQIGPAKVVLPDAGGEAKS